MLGRFISLIQPDSTVWAHGNFDGPVGQLGKSEENDAFSSEEAQKRRRNTLGQHPAALK